MNRSRRPTDDPAEALLEVGRSQPSLHYDVELGLARHQHWIRSDAPMPEWASASAGGTAALAPVAIKTIFSAVLIGALGVAVWHARGRPQPSTADDPRSSSGAEPAQAVAPSVDGAAAPEAWKAPRPILAPAPDRAASSDQPVRRSARVRAGTPRRATRLQRAHTERASTRAASAPEVAPAEAADAAPSDVNPTAPVRVEAAAAPTTKASEDVTVQRAARREVAPAEPREPIREAPTAPPEPRPQAQMQASDDLLEMRQVATAEKLLERSPERALELVRRGDRRFARGYFQQERAYIAIMALIRLGRIDEARARAASFDKHFPALPYGVRIRSALEAQQAAPGAGSR